MDPDSASRREYEFDEHENNTLSDLAGAMRAVGKLLMIIGPVRVILGMVAGWRGDYGSGLAQAVEGACFFLIGNWTGSAADAYHRIVDTRGTDVTHLMSSMVDLKKIYNLQRTVLSIALAAMVLGGVVLMLGAFGGGAGKDKARSAPAGSEDRPKAPVVTPLAAPPAPPSALPSAIPSPEAAPAAIPAPAAAPEPVADPATPATATAAQAAKKAAAAKHGKRVKKVRKRR